MGTNVSWNELKCLWHRADMIIFLSWIWKTGQTDLISRCEEARVVLEGLFHQLTEAVKQRQQLLHVLLRVLDKHIHRRSLPTTASLWLCIWQWITWTWDRGAELTSCWSVCLCTYSSDSLGSSHHVCQSSIDDMFFQVFQHGLDPTGNLVHQWKHQVQLCSGGEGNQCYTQDRNMAESWNHLLKCLHRKVPNWEK